MRVIALQMLREFWARHPDAEQALVAWHQDVKRATWRAPSDIKDVYRNASLIGSNRVVFNIRGSQYRIVVVVQYEHGIVCIRFVETYRAYSEIDMASV